MSKLVGIKTYEKFRSLWENNNINDLSLNFILDTGQLYTHGIFINSAVFGTAANGAVTLSIAGTTNTLALSSHTHSNYYDKSEDLDITNHKIVSGLNDLLFCSGGTLYLGNTDNPTYISGSTLYSTRGNNSYTILDTGNFEITNTLPSGYTYNNTALIKYGNSSHQIDYVKRINTSLSFDYLHGYTQAGTNQLNGIYYGYINFTVDNVYNNPAWAQLRINISSKTVQYRTSADANTWIDLSNPVIPQNALNVSGIVPAPTASNADKVWKTDSEGNPAWRDEKSYTFNNLAFQQIPGTNLMTYNTTATKTILAGDNIAFSYENDILTVRALDTTYSAFTGASQSENGAAGLVPQPLAGDQGKYLKGNGIWYDLTSDLTATLYVGASNGTSTEALSTNGNVHLIFKLGNNYKRFQITGTGHASVTSDANGKITINSNGYSNFGAATDTTAGTAGLVPAPSANQLGSLHYFLCADGTWDIPPNAWNAANTNQDGYIPLLVTGGSAISGQTTEYVLTYVSTETGVVTPRWKTLPANAFKDTWNAASFTLAGYVPQSIKGKYLHANTDDGSLEWVDDRDTTYSVFTGASASDDGTSGLVVAPTAGNQNKFLKGNGTWETPPNTWKAANNSLEGYVPKLATNGGTISTQSTDYVLTFTSGGSGTITPSWKLLPSNAFSNTWTANAVGVAGYVAAPTKADNANMVWKCDANGNPAWRTDSNTWRLNTATQEGYVTAPGSNVSGKVWMTGNDGTPSWQNANNHTHNYLPLTGGKLTSTIHQTLTIRTSNTDSNNWVGIAFRKYINESETAFGGIAMMTETGGSNSLYRYTGTGSNFYKIWDANNHGSGSGLDADKLDSYHSYAFMRTFAMSSGDNYDTKPTETVGSFVAANFSDYTSSNVTLDDLGLYTTLVSFGYGNRTIQFKGLGWNSTLKYRYIGGSDPVLQPWKTIAFTDSNITGNAATATDATYAKYLMNRGSTTSGSEVVISDSGWSIGKTLDGYTNLDIVWSLSWTKKGQTYTPNGGSATNSTDSGNIVMWLSKGNTSNDLRLNIQIDGLLYVPNGIYGDLDGNAKTATKLASSVNLWGRPFNGSSNVSGSLTGTGNVIPDGTTSYTLGNDEHMFEKGYIRRIDTISGYDLRLYTSGTERINIHSSTGNVTAYGSITANGDITTAAKLSCRNGLTIVDANEVHDFSMFWATRTYTDSLNLQLSLDYLVYYAYLTKYWPMVFGTHINQVTSGGLVFSGSDNSYNWGIGTFSPAYKLDVNGDVRATNFRGALIGNADTATSATRLSLSASGVTTLNNFKHSTDLIYMAAGGGNTIGGKPSGVGAFGVLSFKVADGHYGLLLYGTTGHIYIRENSSFSDSNDGGWSKLLSSANYSSYALPLSGGTLNSTTSNTPLILRSNEAHTWVAFRDSSNTFLGSFGVDSNKNPKFYNGSTYTLWHNGNDGHKSDGSGLDADLLDGQLGSYYAKESYFTSGVANHAYRLKNIVIAAGDDYDTLSGYNSSRGSFVAVNTASVADANFTLAGKDNIYLTLVSFGESNRTILFMGFGWSDVLKYRHVGGSSPYQLTEWKTIAFTDSNITGNAATATTATKLSTVSLTLWGNTYWTSGGIPKSVGTSSASASLSYVDTISMSGALRLQRSGGSIQFYLDGTDGYQVAMRVFTESKTLSLGYETSLKSYNTNIYGNIVRLFYGTSGSLGLTLTSGRVGIGTDSPSYKLDVSGAIRATGNIVSNNCLAVVDSAATHDFTMLWTTLSNVEYFNMYSYETKYWNICLGYHVGNISLGALVLDATNGRWGIGTASPGYKLHISGTCGATNYYTTSDLSKKLNITTFSEHIRKFQLKDTLEYAYGVIAQEVEEIFRDGEEGNMTVNYNSVLSYYVGQLENKVKELEEKIKLLETK